MEILNANKVSIYEAVIQDYPKESPFHPSQYYPEYQFGEKELLKNENQTYGAVRNALYLLGLDKDNYGNTKWNPLGEFINQGDKVVIKPNFVLDRNQKNGEVYSVITHPSIIRVICDYVYIALKGKGKIIIADAPQADCDFEKLLEITELYSIAKLYQKEKNFSIEIYDLRQLRLSDFYDSSTRIIEDGDPLGYSIVDYGKKSAFSEIKNKEKYYGSDFDRKEILSHHNQDKNEYCIANTILSADVVISVPKMKTHRKAGVTLCMKNLVGINGNKNYLPHFRIGLPEDGGDEFPYLTKEQKKVMYTNRKLKDNLLAKSNKFHDNLYHLARRGYHLLIKIYPRAESGSVIECGNWHGNETLWRMIVDLNRILIYANKNGEICDTPQRKLFMLVDGIWAGEGNGPLEPDLKKCGIVACGMNPLAVDLVLTEIMGFDINKIPLFRNLLKNEDVKSSIFNLGIKDINVQSNNDNYRNILNSLQIVSKQFKPADGWVGYVERDKGL